jgi:hypothetical protein
MCMYIIMQVTVLPFPCTTVNLPHPPGGITRKRAKASSSHDLHPSTSTTLNGRKIIILVSMPKRPLEKRSRSSKTPDRRSKVKQRYFVLVDEVVW